MKFITCTRIKTHEICIMLIVLKWAVSKNLCMLFKYTCTCTRLLFSVIINANEYNDKYSCIDKYDCK